MTNEQLADAAWAELKLTTDSYPTWKKKGFPATSHWAKAKSLLDQVEDCASPPPITVPFGSRPPIAAVKYQGVNDVVVSNKTVTGLNAQTRSLTFENCRNITIVDVDLGDPNGGILIATCTGTLTIKNVRAKGCGWNVVQLDKVTMSGSISVEALGGTGTEDMISVYSSGGPDAAHPLYVEDCKLQGGAFVSQSGSGIMTESPGHVVVRNNSLLNPGQVGIGVHGPTVKLQGNRLYSDGLGHPIVRVGIDCADPASAGCEVSGSNADWRNSGGGYEPYSTLTNPYPAGWATNNWQWRATPAEVAAMRVVL